jgi:hypothetical protein
VQIEIEGKTFAVAVSAIDGETVDGYIADQAGRQAAAHRRLSS